jgi:hypothetical protein
MKLLKLAVAAAIAVSGLTVTAAPAEAAQRGDRWHNDNGRHHGWRNNRHRRWHNNRRYRSCRWVWRHHHRQRVCYWRYRR